MQDPVYHMITIAAIFAPKRPDFANRKRDVFMEVIA